MWAGLNWTARLCLGTDMDEKPKVYARLNWGNWIADCPIHGEGIAEQVRPGEPFICSRCHPGIHAQMPVRFQGHVIQVPDVAGRAYAFQQAEWAGHLYEVVFPKNMPKIMERVRPRKLQHMNWRPGMTLKDLERENQEHGVK